MEQWRKAAEAASTWNRSEPRFLNTEFSCPECGEGRAWILTPLGNINLFSCLICDVDLALDDAGASAPGRAAA